MPGFLDVNTVFFTVWNYPMSYLEFFGTVANIWCVWLTAKNKVASWPVGLVGIILYFFLFHQIRLYSDMFEQVYFFFISFWGWWLWTHPRRKEESDGQNGLKVTAGTWRGNAAAAAVTLTGSLALGALMSRIHLLLPRFFPAPADYPYWDAFTTVMSFTATALLARRRIENWLLWLTVDAIGVWLYWIKGVKFISLEYLLFFGLAANGLREWLGIINADRKKYGEIRLGTGGGEILPAASRA